MRKALYQLASRLHENPSRSQQHLLSSLSRLSQSGSAYMGLNAGIQVAGPYGNYRDEALAKEFSLRIVCPTGNIGSVIGKGGAVINQIRQESGAHIKVDSSTTEQDDCIIYISAKEVSIYWFISSNTCSLYYFSMFCQIFFGHSFLLITSVIQIFKSVTSRFLRIHPLQLLQLCVCNQDVVISLRGNQGIP